MADPFTIIGGVQTAFSLANTLISYIDDARGAKDDLQGLASKIQSTFTDVSELKSLLVVDETTPNWNEWGRTRAKQCVEQSNFMLQKLGRLLLKNGVTLSPNTSRMDINPSIFGSMLWPFFKRELGDLQTELMLLKVDINSALTTWKSGPESTPGLRRIAGERLQKYKLERESLMRRLLDAKSIRLEASKADSDDDSDVFDPRTGSPKRAMRVSPEERRLFKEWEDAIAEKIVAEQKVEETKAKEAQEKEDEIRRQYVKKKYAEALERANAAKDIQNKISQQLQSYSIPPGERDHIVSAIFERIQPSTQDDQFIRAAFPNGTMPPTSAIEGLAASTHPGFETKRWSIFGKRKGTAKTLASSLPDVLRDPNAPGGVAVLLAVYFDLDPFGAFHGVKLAVTPEATHRWMKKHDFDVDNVSMNFRLLPANCKEAITDRLKRMSSWSPDFTWRILLVHMETTEPKSNMRNAWRPGKASDRCLGAYVVFKRQLRPARLFRGPGGQMPQGKTNQAPAGGLDEAEEEDVDRDDDSEDPIGQPQPPRRPTDGGPRGGQGYVVNDVEDTMRGSSPRNSTFGPEQSVNGKSVPYENSLSRGRRPSNELSFNRHPMVNRRPVYPKISLDFIDTETLNYYDLPWEFDKNDRNFVIITKELSRSETDVLFEHTSRLRERHMSRIARIDDDYTTVSQSHAGRRSHGRSRSRAHGVRFAEAPAEEEPDLAQTERKIKNIEEKMARSRNRSRADVNIFDDDFNDRPVHLSAWDSQYMPPPPLEPDYMRSRRFGGMPLITGSSARKEPSIPFHYEANSSTQITDDIRQLERENAAIQRELEEERRKRAERKAKRKSEQHEEEQRKEEAFRRRMLEAEGVKEKYDKKLQELQKERHYERRERILLPKPSQRSEQVSNHQEVGMLVKGEVSAHTRKKSRPKKAESRSRRESWDSERERDIDIRDVRYDMEDDVKNDVDGQDIIEVIEENDTSSGRERSSNGSSYDKSSSTDSGETSPTSPSVHRRVVEERRKPRRVSSRKASGRDREGRRRSRERGGDSDADSPRRRETIIVEKRYITSPKTVSRRSTVENEDKQDGEETPVAPNVATELALSSEPALDDAYGDFLLGQWTGSERTASKVEEPSSQNAALSNGIPEGSALVNEGHEVAEAGAEHRSVEEENHSSTKGASSDDPEVPQALAGRRRSSSSPTENGNAVDSAATSPVIKSKARRKYPWQR
ncbi:MAG: hypothetical protein M1828_004689 [Chrysothrix sp. TS-e1954]|nr:MAG: hypothetical protein M1828_004689 [Chrysothrix sp. TS-e1954]